MSWDTSKGRKFVVVAFWGEETTVSFHRDAQEADEAYETALAEGADVFSAETKRMFKNKQARPKHEVSSEFRQRAGRKQCRAVCGCGWTSTWQAGDMSMADNAGRRHRNSSEVA